MYHNSKINGKRFTNPTIKDYSISITKGGVLVKSLLSNSGSRIIKKCISLIGMNKSDFAGHSLRSGFISEAKEAGIMNELIMKMTHHKTLLCIIYPL